MPRRWNRTALRQLPLFDLQMQTESNQAARLKACHKSDRPRIPSLAAELRRRLQLETANATRTRK